MSEFPRPVIVESDELGPRRVEMHDRYGYNGEQPTEDNVFRVFLSEKGGMPQPLNHEFYDLDDNTKSFYGKNEKMGEEELPEILDSVEVAT